MRAGWFYFWAAFAFPTRKFAGFMAGAAVMWLGYVLVGLLALSALRWLS